MMAIRMMFHTTNLIADSNKMEKSAASLISLPGEILIDILSRLPVDSVIQCKRVCKTWRSLVDHDPTFLDLHTHQIIKSAGSSADPFCFLLFLFVRLSNHLFGRTTNFRLHFGEYHDDDDDNNEYIDDANKKKKNIFFNHVKLRDKSIYPPFHQCNSAKRISSCNGLILIASISTCCNDMMVLNPVTNEYVYLPPYEEQDEVDLDHHELLLRRLIGFGYHPYTNEYKVVRISWPRHREGGDEYIYVYIYTLGSGRGGWRRIRKIIYLSSTSGYVFDYLGVLLNGALYWIDLKSSSVLSFDLGDEELKILPPPPLEDTEAWYSIGQQLGVLQGCLCLSRSNFHSKTDLWVLMNKDEKEKEWTKKFSIPAAVGSRVLYCENNYRFLAVLESGKILFFGSYALVDGKSRLLLVSYDPETGSVHDEGENFCGHLNGCGLINMIPYVKSSVSLKALGEESTACT